MIQRNSLIKRNDLITRVHKLKDSGMYPYFNAVGSTQGATTMINNKEVLMFGSNNYLGLTGHPLVKEAAKKAIDKYGTSCTGSRFMNGTIDLHLELENELKSFLNKEAVIIFPTGFQVNTGVIPSIADKDDLIFIDEFNHASIIDGCRMSFARKVKYRHNDMGDLHQKLERHKTNKNINKLIITDGIFSMDGDIAKLDIITQLAHQYNSLIMVDCAHSIGVIGKNGSGTASYFNITEDIDLIGGTFSKSLASVGGFVAGSAEIIEYLSHVSRSYMFSASLPPASSAAALAALKLIRRDDSFRMNLWDNTHYAIRLMKENGLDIGNAETPIIPIYIRNSFNTFKIAKALLDNGIYVNPVVAPGVKETDALLRFSLTALHTKKQIEYSINRIAKLVHKFCIL
jgi:8-amino-7-oxononanoate synthase